MKGIFGFVKTTIMGGFFVVLPVVLVVFFLSEAVDAIVSLVEPLTERFQTQSYGGVGVATPIAILLVLAACFVTGLLMSTPIGTFGKKWVEGKLLNHLPGYTILKNLTQRFSGVEDTDFAPVLVELFGGDTETIGFIVEEHGEGRSTVFVPLAPTPTIGHVYFVSQERVRRIDTPFSTVVNSITQWGVGSKTLFQRQ
jgi:uncharacterized membrane protein